VYRRLAIVFLFLSNCVLVFAQQGHDSPTADPVRDYCANVSRDISHAEALDSFCIWVLSFDTKLPNIIGDQHTIRYSTTNGKSRDILDTTGARIAYVDTKPLFSDIEVNRVRVHEGGDCTKLFNIPGAWSCGDYGSDLAMLFGSMAKTRFNFVGENSYRGRPVLVFGFEVGVSDNLRWALKTRDSHGEAISSFPGYRGRLLFDARTFALVRFERRSFEVEKHFPIRFGGIEVDYQKTPLGDGTAFVLPTESVVTFCHDEKHHHCEINTTTFEHWQKFGAKSRILTGTQPE
jgi:hypothetical protein